jgi:hypothetical protein
MITSLVPAGFAASSKTLGFGVESLGVAKNVRGVGGPEWKQESAWSVQH